MNQCPAKPPHCGDGPSLHYYPSTIYLKVVIPAKAGIQY